MAIKDISELLNLLNNKSSTQTTSSNISQEGVNQILQQILGGTQGLAAVVGGQRASGLYNSTTNQQLVNDLITRAAGETAKLQAGTTTKTVQQAPLGGQTGQLIQGAMLLKSLSNTALGKKVVGSISDAITGQQASSIASDVAAGTIPTSGADVAGMTALESNLASGSSLGALSDLGAGLGLDAGTTGAALGTDAALTAGATEAGATAAGADVAGFAALESAGAADAAGTAAAATAAETMGAEELAATAAMAWVICTELNAQNKLSSELYKASAERALKLSPNIMAGYHLWAIPFTRLLRKSATLSRLIAPIARSRCEYLLGKKRVWGWLTVHIGEPICAFLGFISTSLLKIKTDWRTLYGKS